MLSTSTTVVEASCLLPQKRLIEEVAEEEDYFGENDGMVDENIRCAEENDGCTDAVILMSDGESEEEEEWNFPSVDDDIPCGDVLDDPACEDPLQLLNDEESEDGFDDICDNDIDFASAIPRISPIATPRITGNGDAVAPFGENLWWPESADLSNRQYLLDFYEFCEHTRGKTAPMQGGFRTCVELLWLIYNKRVPYSVYGDMVAWHLQNTSEQFKVYQRGYLLKKLEARYYQMRTKPFGRIVNLPHSEVDICLTCHNFEDQLVSLLTDPRIKPQDYLFIDGDPRKLVPDHVEYVGDLNTGRSYRSAEKKLIVDSSRQKCVPLLFYLDGATITNCNGLTMCALKFTLGIFNAHTRDQPYAWRVLGYMVKVPKATGKAGQQEFETSKHVDAKEYGTQTIQRDAKRDDTATDGDFSDTDEKSQQFHTMLDVLLQDVRKYMGNDSKNIVWLLGGKYLMELVLYVELIKGDSAEADKHCGKYQSRSGNVKHLCRYCHVPNEETDDPFADFALKTKAEIDTLVKRKDSARLKEILQHVVHNSWYKLRFSPHCSGSVHGCTPLDILHWMQINKYSYIIDCFFEQTGEDSKFIKDIEGVAASMGPLYARQSDSAAQRTDFQNGLRPQGLTAHMRTGVMLVLLSVLRSSKGRSIMKFQSAKYDRYKKHFGSKQQILDWIRLLELYLMLEAWLRKEKVLPSDVFLLRSKMRILMSHEKQVCKRESGMQFRTFNYHAAIHIPDQILDFGVMAGFNCEINEMHHKDDKSDALRTQKRESKFDSQLAKNIHGRTTLQYADLELKKNLKVRQFFDRPWELPPATATDVSPTTTLKGLRWTFAYKEPGSGEHHIRMYCEKKRRAECQPTKDLVEYLEEKLDELEGYVDTLPMHTSVLHQGCLYRATSNFMDGPWRDWAMVRLLGQEEDLPCHMAAFVDLRKIPVGSPVAPGIYMIIETARRSTWPQEKNLGTFFEPYIKNTTTRIGSTRVFRDYQFVNVDCIRSPAIVIPDLGNKVSNTCLRLLPRSQWASTFESWLRSEDR